MADTQTEPSSAAEPKPPRRRRRWLRLSLLGLVGLVLLVVVVVQIVLMTSLPKRIVLPQVEKLLGLRISADRLSTGWLGHTELDDVTLGLPLDDTSFLKVKALKIRHNTLFGLILGRPVAVDSIEVDEPDVVVTQDARGNWNLQQVAVLLGKLGGSETGKESTSEGVPKLPVVKLVDGVVTVKDNRKHVAKLSPVNVDGDPEGRLVWTYEVRIGPKDAEQVHLKGEVAPGSNWQHSLTVDVAHLDPLVTAFGVPGSYGAEVHARWDGQLAAGGKVGGTLVLTDVSAKKVPSLGDVAVTGGVGVEVAGGTVTVRPSNLTLTTGNLTLPNVSVAAGSIVYDAEGLHATGVKVNALGGAASVSADVDPRTLTSKLSADWTGLALAKGVSQDGSLTASLTQPFPNQPVITVDLQSHGRVGQDPTLPAGQAKGQWDAAVKLTGQGTSWTDIDWVLNTPTLTYGSNGKTYALNGLSATVTERLPSVRLTLSQPPAKDVVNAPFFAGGGAFDASTKVWTFDLTGGVNTSFQDSPVPVTLALHAAGNADAYNLKELTVTAAGTTLAADGKYDRGTPNKPNPKPVDLHVAITQANRLQPNGPVQGSLSGDFKVVGVLFSDRDEVQAKDRVRPYLTTTGTFKAGGLVLFDRPIGDVNVNLTGETATPRLPGGGVARAHTTLRTTDFFLFQAPWQFDVLYPNDDDQLEVTLSTTNLPLDVLAKAAGSTQAVGGQVTAAKWTALVGGFSADDVSLRSEYHLARVSAAGVAVDAVDAKASLTNGVFRLDELVAKNGAGKTTVKASLPLLASRRVLTGEVTVDQWPYAISAALGARASAHATFDVDFARKAATGQLTSSLDLLLTRIPVAPPSIAHLELDARLNNRVIEMPRLAGRILNGSVDGSATVDFDKPLEAFGRVQWQDIDAGKLAEFIPAMAGLGGVYGGTVSIGPAIGPRPLEPVRIDVNVSAVGGHFRSVKLGRDGALPLMATAVAYVNADRFVVKNLTVNVADGAVNIWGRAGRTLGTQTLLVDFEHLDLDQIAHLSPTFKPTEKVPGVLSGNFGFVANGADLTRLLGKGHVDLRRTDLGNFGPIAALYGLLNAGGGSGVPTGSGSVDLALEQSTLRVGGFRFYNRGVDAHGIFTVGPVDFADFDRTPVGGQVVGAVRTLKDSNIAVLSDFDQIFAAVQRNLTTINVTGTIKNHQIANANAADIGSALRQLVVGDAKDEAANQSSEGGK